METFEPTSAPSAPPSPQHGVLKRIFYSPTVAAISSILGILGFFIGIIFYYAAKREPSLTYYVSPTRTAIVQKGLENLSINFYGNIITNDISAVHIQVWNAGKRAIHTIEIEKPVKIKLGGNARILKSTIKTLRDISISQASTSDENNVMTLNWKILEDTDGINIQIIYEGNVKAPISVEGLVEDQPSGISKYSEIFKKRNHSRINFEFRRIDSTAIRNCYASLFTTQTSALSPVLWNTCERVYFNGLFNRYVDHAVNKWGSSTFLMGKSNRI